MFNDILRTQLLLKNIITPEDWEVMGDHIQYDFLYDNHFAELKETELATERINLAQLYEPYIGKYYSNDYVRRQVLRQSDEEIIEQDALIEKEIDSGMIPDPMEPDLPLGSELGVPEAPTDPIQAPPVPKEPEAPLTPKGGEI